MSAALGVAVLWFLFAATHMALSSVRRRPRLVAVLGERGYLGVFSLLAVAIFVPLVSLYLGHRHQGPLLWSLPIGVLGLWTVYALQAVAWTLIVGGLAIPSAASLGQSTSGEIPVRGLHRVTRHALFMGTGLFGVLHLPMNGFASDVAFWAGFPIFAVLGCWHQDRRKLATEGAAFRAWFAQTSFFPLLGRGSWRGLREIPYWLPLTGAATAAALRWLHGPLFR